MKGRVTETSHIFVLPEDASVSRSEPGSSRYGIRDAAFTEKRSMKERAAAWIAIAVLPIAGAALACGYHDPDSVSFKTGVLNWMYPDSLKTTVVGVFIPAVVAWALTTLDLLAFELARAPR
jgi:hypothetical protein